MFVQFKYAVALAAVLAVSSTEANEGWPWKKKEVKQEAPKPQAKPEKPDDKAPKPYAEVITRGAKSSYGFVTVHFVKDKHYFEIPDSIMGRDILIVSRISKAPADREKRKTGYPGDIVDEQTVRFERGPQNKVFVRNISYYEQSNDTLGLYQAVANSNLQPIVSAFDVKAIRRDSVSGKGSVVIEIGDYIKGEKGIFNFGTYARKNIGLQSIIPEASYVDTIKAFPLNVEIRMVKTFTRSAPVNASSASATYNTPPSTPLTYELNSSMLLLPEVPMRSRFMDPRVGYFAIRYTDFDSNPQGIEYRARITRWRLEPRDEDMERYKRGELVEPKKPIVIYIDPATPKKWVPYLIAGVNDWQQAFEKAGFKNAIYGLEAPADDPSWSLEDARHSAIVYKPSDIPNASGPHVHDPRSGEILETHINWYHNVMSLLQNWYTVQAGPIDPRARTPHFDDELMGQLIRFVSSHEVGHTLGLRHNFGSSATVPVEKLRDKAWVEANGHTPSIMDYARFNYVAQPGDGVSEKGIFPRIGIYDEWSIEWGYRYLPQFERPEDEVHFSNKSIIAKLASDNRYRFGTEMDRDDPRNQSEDLGDDAMKASEYGILNLQRVMPGIMEWTREPDKGYSRATALYADVVAQYGRYMGHVTTNIAGAYHNYITVEEKGKYEEFVPEQTQRRAVEFLCRQLFNTPKWLIDKELTEKAGVNPVSRIGSVQQYVIDRIISKRTMDKMLKDEAFNGREAYTPDELLADLKKNIWSELQTMRPVDIYRRNLQNYYVKALSTMLDKQGGGSQTSSPMPTPSDASGIARNHLTGLLKDITQAANSTSGITKAHYLNLAALITNAIDPRK